MFTNNYARNQYSIFIKNQCKIFKSIKSRYENLNKKIEGSRFSFNYEPRLL